jgi:hypothetical protein
VRRPVQHRPGIFPLSFPPPPIDGVLLKAGRDDEARVAIERFELPFPADRHEAGGPTFGQLGVLKGMKSRL